MIDLHSFSYCNWVTVALLEFVVEGEYYVMSMSEVYTRSGSVVIVDVIPRFS